MFIKFTGFSLLTALLCCCMDDSTMSESITPTLDFEWTTRGDCSSPSLEIMFQNRSAAVSNFLWEFGDGTTSSETNPVKIYSKAGNYTVRLYAETNQVEKEISVFRNSDGTGPSALLRYEQNPDNKRRLTFTIDSDQPNYRLDFGDGTYEISNSKSVQHQYPLPGTYFVTLTVESEQGKNCSSMRIVL